VRYRGRGVQVDGDEGCTGDHAVRDPAFTHLDATGQSVSSTVNEIERHKTAKRVVGIDGRRLTIADLPSPDTTRWVPRRKAEVLAAVCGGLLSLEEACSRYALSHEEILSWARSLAGFGLSGLRTTRTQLYQENSRGRKIGH
jgi:Protein of unknown function (DUF1153)